MINGALNMAADAGNFCFQRRDARIKLCHRKRVEVLAGEQVHWIIRPARQILLCVHAHKR